MTKKIFTLLFFLIGTSYLLFAQNIEGLYYGNKKFKRYEIDFAMCINKDSIAFVIDFHGGIVSYPVYLGTYCIEKNRIELSNNVVASKTAVIHKIPHTKDSVMSIQFLYKNNNYTSVYDSHVIKCDNKEFVYTTDTSGYIWIPKEVLTKMIGKNIEIYGNRSWFPSYHNIMVEANTNYKIQQITNDMISFFDDKISILYYPDKEQIKVKMNRANIILSKASDTGSCFNLIINPQLYIEAYK